MLRDKSIATYCSGGIESRSCGTHSPSTPRTRETPRSENTRSHAPVPHPTSTTVAGWKSSMTFSATTEPDRSAFRSTRSKNVLSYSLTGVCEPRSLKVIGAPQQLGTLTHAAAYSATLDRARCTASLAFQDCTS